MGFGLAIAGMLGGAGQAGLERARAKREETKRQLAEEGLLKRLEIQQTFQANQNAITREHQMSRDEADRAYRTSEREAAQQFKLDNATPKAPNIQTIYTEDGREQKVIIDPADPTNFTPIGGAKGKDPGVNVTTNIGGDKFEEGMAKHQANLLGTLYEDGLKANRDIGMIDRLDGLFRQFETGGKAGIKQFAGEFGINSEGLDEIQAAQAIINKMVPEQRAPGTGPMSDADLALFKQSLPRIIGQPGGNALIIDTLKGIALYQQQQGQIAQEVMTGRLGRAEAFDALASLENPLETFNKALGQTGEDRSLSIRQKYGLED